MFSVKFITFRGFQGALILVWDAWYVFNSKFRDVCGTACVSGKEYLVSRRKGVMFHFAFRLAVTPLCADVTRYMLNSSSDKTIKILIIAGVQNVQHKPTGAKQTQSAQLCHVAKFLQQTLTWYILFK